MRTTILLIAVVAMSCDKSDKADDKAGEGEQPSSAELDFQMLCDEAKAAKGSADGDRTAFATAVILAAFSFDTPAFAATAFTASTS